VADAAISGAILLLLLSTFVVDRARPAPESPDA
jgi:hypothetical protein